ncbi:PAXNEB protein-domain-containing protein [Xylariaceae sp. FL0804]|nr:PAXNEB protein-domain-containing protein [Xylariaceae sp. FL0804]
MSFRKRNAVISSPARAPSAASKAESVPVPGVRPSPLDGRPTTSTGTASLDSLLAGHSGMPLGTSILIEEHGTTDFAGILLRYYVAEGLVQGHQVHALGLHEGWRAELPGISTDTRSSGSSDPPAGDRMKIAWRYESLGSAGAARDREAQRQASTTATGPAAVFCHSFDLSKKLAPSDVKGQIGFHPSMVGPTHGHLNSPPTSAFKLFLRDLSSKLANSPPAWVHRVIVPNLLSPTMYSSSSCRPEEVLQFLHSLRALLRQYPTKLTAILTLPLSLYPRSTGLTRWMELLCDGVLELIPLQSSAIHKPPPSAKTDSKSEQQVQGLLKVHSLPILHEKGGGAHSAHDDQSFSLSRTKGLIAYIVVIRGSMASPMDRPPLRISKVAGRYLLFDIDDVMYLRRHHNICSVFVGSVPQNPQQNVFTGLPLELMPEEAQVLVDREVGYVVDDVAFHPARLASLDDAFRREYLQSLKKQGLQARQAVLKEQRSKSVVQEGRAKSKKKHKQQQAAAAALATPEASSPDGTHMGAQASAQGAEDGGEVSLFDDPTPAATAPSGAQSREGAAAADYYAITPTTSSSLFFVPPSSSSSVGGGGGSGSGIGSSSGSGGSSSAARVVVEGLPASYALYAHLQARGYYLMPGLRFGCDYNVYPGDPLRFHSHFQAVALAWREPVAVLDLVAGGRLGTNVKKGFLIGGEVIAEAGTEAEAQTTGIEKRISSSREEGGREEGAAAAAGGDGGGGSGRVPPVRTFCIEWAGM